VHNAWLATIEEGFHTGDIYDASVSREKCSTTAFTKAVIDHLGKRPQQLKPVAYQTTKTKNIVYQRPTEKETRRLTGVDVFVYSEIAASEIAPLVDSLQGAEGDVFELKLITNRGTKIWPEGLAETFCTDHWRCRYYGKAKQINLSSVIDLLDRLEKRGIDIIKVENLYYFGDNRGYSLAQGE